MNAETRNLLPAPEYQAWIDWRQEGAFFVSRFHGDERNRYIAEARKIEREFEQ